MASPASSTPLPELALDTTARLDRLMHLANRAWTDTRRLIEVSAIKDLNVAPDFVIFVEPFVWAPLPAEQQPLADAAMNTVQAWLEAAERVIQLNQAASLREFQQHSHVLQAIVDRSAGGAGKAPAGQLTEVTRAAEEAFIAQIDLRGRVSSRGAPAWMWLPDTNALYDRHELHLWPASTPTLLVIAPAVIAELDTHKQDARNPDRQKKARAIIQQIKEIRRHRDQVIRGRPLRLHFTGNWHQRWDVLPNWLDRGHADDQILAIGVELSWTSLRSAITLVTSDPNLQIKAERVGLAYVDQDQPTVLVAPPVPDPLAVVYRAKRVLIYAGFHRGPGDRFLTVDGHEAILRTHLEQGAAELS